MLVHHRLPHCHSILLGCPNSLQEPIYSPGWKRATQECLAQEHNTMTPVRARTLRLFNPESNVLCELHVTLLGHHVNHIKNAISQHSFIACMCIGHTVITMFKNNLYQKDSFQVHLRSLEANILFSFSCTAKELVTFN